MMSHLKNLIVKPIKIPSPVNSWALETSFQSINFTFLHIRLRHRMIEEKHRGHDLMHAEMILILFAAITVAQVLLFVWKVRHKRSYMVLTYILLLLYCLN